MQFDFLRQFVRRPQQVWIRRALFQVHLWVGLFAALYVVLIGITGSILVFRKELESVGRPAALRAAWDGITTIAPGEALERARQAAPGTRATFLYAPRADQPAYLVYMQERGTARGIFIDSRSGAVLADEPAAQHAFLRWVGQFHYFLLLPRTPGLQLNGIGSALLLVLTLSGLVLWWPGIASWKRGFAVDFSRHWKRINFDAHNVIGFWTLLIVSFWAVSGVYFAWPAEFTAFVNRFSPVAPNPARVAVAPAAGARPLPLAVLLDRARAASPGSHFSALSIPAGPKAPLLVYMSRTQAGDLLRADFVYLDPFTGRVLSLWQRGQTRTAGEWLIWSMHPFHFGTRWGLGVKILWALLGLSLPALVITGCLMYWNRFLGRKWRQLSARRSTAAPAHS